MSIENLHPVYRDHVENWQLCRHSFSGESVIKSKGKLYLPATSGQIVDGALTDVNSIGAKAYEAYKLRAIYPDIFSDAIEAAIGIMHKEPVKIDLPKNLEILRETSTVLNEPLDMLLRKINVEQLKTGRLGLLGDIQISGTVEKPVIFIYNELSIRNWVLSSDQLDLVSLILDESCYKIDDSFNWKFNKKYRLLSLVDKNGIRNEFGDRYGTELVFPENDIANKELLIPQIKGNTLNKIPFVFINSRDLSATPDKSPLTGLANLCLAIYRAEADYRQNLFMQGQDTLVRIGSYQDEDELLRTGAGAKIDVQIGGDAKYIGVSSLGLSEQRESLQNDYNKALRKSGQLIDATSRAKESGDALRIRVAAQTATLPQIAKTGAAGLEKVLKDLAIWYGDNPDDVRVTPNLNFVDSDYNGQTLVQIVQAKMLGIKLSDDSIHEWMRDQGFTRKSYDEELALISNEEPIPGTGLPSPVDS